MGISGKIFFIGAICLLLLVSLTLVSAQSPTRPISFSYGVTQCGPTCGEATAATLVHHFGVTTESLEQIYDRALIFGRDISGNGPRRGLTTQQVLNLAYRLFEYYNSTGVATGGLTSTGHGSTSDPAGLPVPIPGGGTTWKGSKKWSGGNPAGTGLGGCPESGTGTFTVFQLGRSGGMGVGHFVMVLAVISSDYVENKSLAPPHTAWRGDGWVHTVLYYDPIKGTAQEGEVFEWTSTSQGREGIDFKGSGGKNVNVGRGGFSISR